jgi:hypothetical protein
MAPSTRSPPRPATVGVTRARQGRLGRNVFWVLVATLALVVLGFFAAWTWKSGDFASTQPSHADRQASAGHFAAPPPASAVRGTDSGRPAAPAQQP